MSWRLPSVVPRAGLSAGTTIRDPATLVEAGYWRPRRKGQVGMSEAVLSECLPNTRFRPEDPPDGLRDLTASVARHLDAAPERSCWLVSFRRQRWTGVAEFAVAHQNGNGNGSAEIRHYIAKLCRHDRGQESFDTLVALRRAGFRPPSWFTVIRPVAYIPDGRVLLQEKAQGRPLGSLLFERAGDLPEALAGAADWLATLHAASVDGPSRIGRTRTSLIRYTRELAASLPDQAGRLERLALRALEGLEPPNPTPLVPSHGDFHPQNLFVSNGRFTAIDLDQFGWQERAADVAYFLAQTAIMGYFRLGSFAATESARACFLGAYLRSAPDLPQERFALHMGVDFLQSLHYELCVLHTNRTTLVEPWLRISERCLLKGDSSLGDRCETC